MLRADKIIYSMNVNTLVIERGEYKRLSEMFFQIAKAVKQARGSLTADVVGGTDSHRDLQIDVTELQVTAPAYMELETVASVINDSLSEAHYNAVRFKVAANGLELDTSEQRFDNPDKDVLSASAVLRDQLKTTPEVFFQDGVFHTLEL